METPQTRRGFQKITSPPVKVKVYAKYTVSRSSGEKSTPIEESGVEAWLHPLTMQEISDCQAVSTEGFIHFKSKGGGDDESLLKSDHLYSCQQVFYSLRRNGEPDTLDRKAPRLFEDEREVMLLYQSEINRLVKIYSDAFVPNRDEIKNCLRERLGLGLETPSTSPATSRTPDVSSLEAIGEKTPTT
jgi:hypothetical protein